MADPGEVVAIDPAAALTCAERQRRTRGRMAEAVDRVERSCDQAPATSTIAAARRLVTECRDTTSVLAATEQTLVRVAHDAMAADGASGTGPATGARVRAVPRIVARVDGDASGPFAAAIGSLREVSDAVRVLSAVRRVLGKGAREHVAGPDLDGLATVMGPLAVRPDPVGRGGPWTPMSALPAGVSGCRVRVCGSSFVDPVEITDDVFDRFEQVLVVGPPDQVRRDESHSPALLGPLYFRDSTTTTTTSDGVALTRHTGGTNVTPVRVELEIDVNETSLLSSGGLAPPSPDVSTVGGVLYILGLATSATTRTTANARTSRRGRTTYDVPRLFAERNRTYGCVGERCVPIAEEVGTTRR